jgi:GGDEF domain-containing protein
MGAGRAGGGGDHYYWLTAFLAARGAQTRTCRVIAATMISLGMLPLVLIASPAGPQGPQARTIALLVTAAPLIVGPFWLRARWPSRRLSTAGVVAGTAATVAGSLIPHDPVVGLLCATAFTSLTVYTAFFHRLRVLVLVWAGGLVTLAVLTVRLSGDPALAVVGVAIVVVINLLVGYACRTATRLIDTDVHQGDLEPLTGLLNSDAFAERAATLLASRSRDDDRYFVLVLVAIDGSPARPGSPPGDQVRVAVGQTLRENVRQNAVIGHVGAAEFLIADTFTTPDASPLVERLHGAITTTPPGLSASMGVVSTPLRPLTGHPPDEVLDEVVSIATGAMHEARALGGNRARYVLSPRLSVLDETFGGSSADG